MVRESVNAGPTIHTVLNRFSTIKFGAGDSRYALSCATVPLQLYVVRTLWRLHLREVVGVLSPLQTDLLQVL